jgi:hypothetical protein
MDDDRIDRIARGVVAGKEVALAQKLALGFLHDSWTTATKEELDFAKKNLKLGRKFWDGSENVRGVDGMMVYVFETFLPEEIAQGGISVEEEIVVAVGGKL